MTADEHAKRITAAANAAIIGHLITMQSQLAAEYDKLAAENEELRQQLAPTTQSK